MPSYHTTRFEYDPRRDVVWRTLVDAYFQRLIRRTDTVLELGCGYGHFINAVGCARKIAIDVWPGAAEYLASDVTPLVGNITDLSGVADSSVDFAFSSNVFEHLTKSEFAAALSEVRRVLRPHGTLNIVQPNYRFCASEYFDDYTHVSIYSDRSLCDFLCAHQFQIVECVPRFLPLTVKSNLPVWPPLIRAYLRLPVRPFGKQMFVRACVERSDL